MPKGVIILEGQWLLFSKLFRLQFSIRNVFASQSSTHTYPCVCYLIESLQALCRIHRAALWPAAPTKIIRAVLFRSCKSPSKSIPSISRPYQVLLFVIFVIFLLRIRTLTFFYTDIFKFMFYSTWVKCNLYYNYNEMCHLKCAVQWVLTIIYSPSQVENIFITLESSSLPLRHQSSHHPSP